MNEGYNLTNSINTSEKNEFIDLLIYLCPQLCLVKVLNKVLLRTHRTSIFHYFYDNVIEITQFGF